MSDTTKNKRGSSRRKGDEFQDLTALRLLLELYAKGDDFEVHLEYEKAEAIDDIVIFSEQHINAIQAKYAIDPLAVYEVEDFTKEKSPVYFGKYAKGWRKLCEIHSVPTISGILLSNRGRGSTLNRIIGQDGKFKPDFINNSLKKDPSIFRGKLKQICGYSDPDDEDGFQGFLKAFDFHLGQRPLQDLINQIQGEILDHKFGISDRSVFFELKELVQRHAVKLHQPIKRANLDEIFRKVQGRFLLPQIFPVDTKHFVELANFSETLRQEIDGMESGYLVVTGLPGSGKSTSLSQFFDCLSNDSNFATCRYFCFVRPNDDQSRLRLEADSLRVNLLTELHTQFGHLLNRQFDYGEHRLAEVLSELGSLLQTDDQKLLILLDGLDHAERDPQIRESVLRALPTSLPKGVVIVVGTQELKHWQPFALKEGRNRHHVPIPAFSSGETGYFLTEKHNFELEDYWIEEIHNKSQGLPLYLRYVASWLHAHQRDPQSLEAMPAAGDGDIRNYYERLWANFDNDGMSYGRYLCGVLAVLKFPVRREELRQFQSAISQIEMEGALRSVAHLLREENEQLSIFHDSFRAFVNTKFDEAEKRDIAKNILSKLKEERGSNRWFIHAFQYALDVNDDGYLLTEVNKLYVDLSLQYCRPTEEIKLAIELAAKAASRSVDLVALARLGSLRYRTHQRLEQFDYAMLAGVQLALNRVEDVLTFCCRPNKQSWSVEIDVAEQVMIWCSKTDHKALGEKLFNIFLDTEDVIPSGAVLGIYSRQPAKALKWLSSYKHERGILDRIDHFLPGYAPQLEEFLESRFLYGPPNDWKRFKRIKRLFPNHTTRHILLRLVAKLRPRNELAQELEDYLSNTPQQTNLEIASYAAFAGFPLARVQELAGPIELPSCELSNKTSSQLFEACFDKFFWTAIVLGYENDPVAIRNITSHIGKSNTMYSGFLRFLLQNGICFGQASTRDGSKEEIYLQAESTLELLFEAGAEEQPNEMDTLRACRPMLKDILFQLTKLVSTHPSERLDTWCDKLIRLRKCEMWTSHWGISETVEDYRFELRIWEKLVEIPSMRSRMLPILRSCAETYEKATALKAGSRCEHFLWLATIAANCGWKTEASKWRDKGSACSLTYGYHKDVTLDYLIDVLDLINEHEPEQGLERSAAILEMAKWMRDVTDDRMTNGFEQSVFRVVLQTNRKAAFALIRFFQKLGGGWKMLGCLEQYCLSIKDGDPETAWVLKNAFAPHSSERGEHSKQIIRVARALRDFGIQKNPIKSQVWKNKYSEFICTSIDPAWWPDDIWDAITINDQRKKRRAKDPYSSSIATEKDEYTLNGKPTPRSQIEDLLSESLESFSHTLDQLRTENSYFHDSHIINAALESLSTKATSIELSLRLREVAQNAGNIVDAKSLHRIAQNLFNLGESDAGFQCLLLAYQRSTEFNYGTLSGLNYLTELCERDHEQTATYLAERCEPAFRSDHGGYDLPRMIARYYAASGDIDHLRVVFEDYLNHCIELFDHLPKHENYSWLKGYSGEEKDEHVEIIQFIFDLMEEPEIEQAKRLVCVIANLSKSRPEIVCKTVCNRITSSKPLLRRRLLLLIESLALICPQQLASHIDPLLPLLEEENFQLRKTLIRTLQTINESSPLSSLTKKALDEANRSYSPVIAYPTRKFIDSEPSPDFLKFFKKGVLFELQDQIDAISELLDIPVNVILSYFESKLRSTSWSLEEETEQLKRDWESHSHHQNIIWFVPRFHTRVSELFQKFIHECVVNGRYTAETLATLENIIREGDPAFIAELPKVKPSDIPALEVDVSAVWLDTSKLDTKTLTKELSPSEWTSVHEERLQSQTDGRHPEFVSNFRVRSLLVRPELANQPETLPPPNYWPDRIPLNHSKERLTITESQQRLIAKSRSIDSDSHILPLVAKHDNRIDFDGFRLLTFIHRTWLDHYNLTLKGTEIHAQDDCIAHLEEWQEGYEDETYSRNLLSTGTRLIIRNDWLQKLLNENDRALVIHTEETRRWFKDFWKKEPTSESSHKQVICYT